MSQQRRFNVRAPWALPVILALLIALLVLGVIFGSKIRNAFNAATSTPQKVVVTATPGSATPATPIGGTPNPASPTPSSNLSKSTPVESATAPPTVVGLQLGKITRTAAQVAVFQQGADRGDTKYTLYLDPRKVVQDTLPTYGFTQGFQITAPNPNPTPTPHPEPVDNRPLIDFIVSYQNKDYTVVVAQPNTRGPKGVWVIVTIDSGRQNI